ncbi:MAG: CaiB/BaiF CoA transferase family protein [Dehalococcoidia bacterium]
MTLASGPLHGTRVLDACDALAVYATRLLVGLGAEVVRLEPPGGDPMRNYPPLVDGLSLYFEHFNAGKRSLTLDMSTDRGVAWLRRLVRSCNAVVESGNAADLLSARVGVERLRDFRPGLVLVSVTPFGLSGPRGLHAGGDLTVAAAGGLLALNGKPGETPFRPGGEQAAHMAGLIAANATLLGIFDQQRSGRGCHIEVPATFAATLATLQTANANFYTWHGRLPKRRGAGLLPAFRSLFEAADGWVVLIALPGQWENLVRLLTAHDAVGDLAALAYQDADYRVEAGEHINGLIGAFTGRYGKQYLFEAAQNAGLACVPVNHVEDIAADPFLRQRGFFRSVEQPSLGRPLEYAGPPFHFAEREIGTRSAAPTAGQDDRALWVQELGMTEETLAAFRSREGAGTDGMAHNAR